MSGFPVAKTKPEPACAAVCSFFTSFHFVDSCTSKNSPRKHDSVAHGLFRQISVLGILCWQNPGQAGICHFALVGRQDVNKMRNTARLVCPVFRAAFL